MNQSSRDAERSAAFHDAEASREVLIAQLRAELDSAQEDLRRIRQSPSYRLTRAVTRPLRVIARRRARQ